jgi:hypothetical protein
MRIIRHNIAGIIFAGLGVYFLYLDMMPMMHMDHDMTAHGNTLFGIGEMTWMWFTMAIVHFFLNDCGCKSCKGKE